jgi:ATP-dependent helicase/DNAse subunit B
MACQIQALLGPARSGKTSRLFKRYAEKLATDMARRRPGRATWIAPNRYAVENVKSSLLSRLSDGCFSPQVLTFEEFSELVLAASPTPVRHISVLQKRLVLRQIVRRMASAGELPYLQSVAATPGLIDAIAAQISELKRLEIWPEEFHASASARRGSPKSARRGSPDPAEIPDRRSPKGRDLWADGKPSVSVRGSVGRPATEQKDQELARIYAEYQEVLTRSHLYDAEGRFWSARTLLAEGCRDSIKRLELVVVDGFTDLTRPQHEMLQSLAEEVDEIVVSVPVDFEEPGGCPVRRDLFSKSIGMLEELKRRHLDVRVVASRELRVERPEPDKGQGVKRQEPERGVRLSTLDSRLLSFSDRLFRPPQGAMPAAYTGDVEFWEAVSPLREIQGIARDIKERFLAGRLRAEDVLVVYRSLREVAPLVEETFAEYRIPAFVDVRRPLQGVPFVRNLQLLFRLDQGDWEYDDVLAAIRNRSIRWPELAGRRDAESRGIRIVAERHVRRLQIPGGRAALLGQLRRAAGGEGDRNDENSEIQAAAKGLEALAAFFDGLPRAATPAEWASVVQSLVPLCGGAGDTSGTFESFATADSQACRQIVETLYGLRKLEERIGTASRALTRTEFGELLADVAAHESLPQSLDTTGRVRVLSAISARGAEASHVYFAGLTEHAMPANAGAQGYYSPRDTARLIRNGLPLVSPQRRYEEEILLFYEIITRARERLVLSFAALDEKAQPVLPSPFLEEARRVAGVGVDGLETNPTVKVLRRLDLRPVDRDARPLCVREFRTRAVCDAVVDGGSPERLQTFVAAGGEGDAGAALLDGLSIVAARAERDAFGPAEGLFASEKAARALARQFGPLHPWSPTALEGFALCPFRFLMARVLEIEPLDDLELATDYRRRGGLVHQCLVELYQRLARVESVFLSSHVDAAQVKAGMLAFIEAQIARLEGGGYADALEAIDLEQVRNFSETLHLQQQCYDGWNGAWDGPPWPVHFEVRFGPARGGVQKEGEDPLSTDDPFTLDLGDEQIKLTGRVDRIDVGTVRGRTVFNIIDYKTGAVDSLSAKDVRRGLQLQTPLYAMAVEEHLLAARGALAWQADYWWLRESGFGNKGAKARSSPFALRELTEDGLAETAEWLQLKSEIKDRIRHIVQSVRRGEFVVYSQDEQCTRTCPYSSVCRVGQVRSLEKEWRNEGIEE